MVNKPTSSLLDYYHDGTQTCLGLDKRVLAVLTAERLGPIFGVACFKKCRYLGLNSTFALAVAGTGKLPNRFVGRRLMQSIRYNVRSSNTKLNISLKITALIDRSS